MSSDENGSWPVGKGAEEAFYYEAGPRPPNQPPPPPETRAARSPRRKARPVVTGAVGGMRLPRWLGAGGKGSVAADDVITGDIATAYNAVAKADPANILEVAASQLPIVNSYYQSVLSQARQSFRAAIVAASVGLTFFIAAVGLTAVQGKLNAAVISAVSGGIVETIAGLNFWLYGRTATQLDVFHLRLEQTQRYLLANSVCETISDPERDKARSRLVETMIIHRTESQVLAPQDRDTSGT